MGKIYPRMWESLSLTSALQTAATASPSISTMSLRKWQRKGECIKLLELFTCELQVARVLVVATG